jgi:hypothetical protein
MKIIFCLPGSTYSREFLLSWSDLMMQATAKGHQIMVAQNLTRQMCISAGDASKGPFQGQEYDAVMWIGEGTIFKPEDFFNLLESPHNITAGIYMTENLQNFDVIRTTSADFPEGKYLRPEDIVGAPQYVPVDYAGMNWMLFRKGIFEKIPYPYIWSEPTEPSEEKVFNKCAGPLGPIHIDTTIRVGNQKRMIL